MGLLLKLRLRVKVTHLDGREEEVTFTGENMALGLAAVLHKCLCGQSRFVDGGDRVECSCGRILEYFEDEDELIGYLH